MENIKITLGNKISDVISNSNDIFKSSKVLASEDVTVESIFCLKYFQDEVEIEIPNCRAMYISIKDSLVKSIDLYPHLDYLTFEVSKSLLQRLIILFSAKYWDQVKGKFIPIELLKIYFENYENNFAEIRKWENDKSRVNLSIERKWRKDDFIPLLLKKNTDLFLIKLKFQSIS